MTKIAVFLASFIAELIYTERAPNWLWEACRTIKSAIELNGSRYGLAAQLGDPVPKIRSLPYSPSRWWTWRSNTSDDPKMPPMVLEADLPL